MAADAFATRKSQRSGGEQLVVLLAHPFVAFAGCRFEPLSIRDRNAASAIVYQAGLLQVVGPDRYAGALNAEYHREEFVSEQKGIGSRAIVRDQKPAAAALQKRVQTVAGCGLRELGDDRLDEPLQQLPERLAFSHFSAEDVGCDAKRVSRGDLDGSACVIDGGASG